MEFARTHAAVIAGAIDAGSAPRSRWTPGTGGLAAVCRLRAMFRDLRPQSVGEPRQRSQREHATLSLSRAAAELAEPYGHVASRTFVPASVSTTTT
jgi:hypothetical protein